MFNTNTSYINNLDPNTIHTRCEELMPEIDKKYQETVESIVDRIYKRQFNNLSYKLFRRFKDKQMIRNRLNDKDEYGMPVYFTYYNATHKREKLFSKLNLIDSMAITAIANGNTITLSKDDAFFLFHQNIFFE